MKIYFKHIILGLGWIFFMQISLISQMPDPVILNIENGIGEDFIDVTITAVQFNEVLGLQFGLQFDASQIEFLDFTSTDEVDLGNSINILDNEIIVSWVGADANGVSKNVGEPIFTFHFRSTNVGQSELLVSEENISLEASVIFDNTPTITQLIINPGLINADGNGIFGKIYFDEDDNCEYNDETGLRDWPIKISDGTDNWYRYTNDEGTFVAGLDPGQYTLEILDPEYPNWTSCEQSINFEVVDGNDPINIFVGANLTIDCPLLEIDMAVNRLRRCFDNNTYTVKYCNYGTLVDDVQVLVTLDPDLSISRSTIPVSSQNGQVYTFELGSLGIAHCGSFKFDALVDCENTILDQTLCAKAKILPEIYCDETQVWEGAQLTVSGNCVDQKATFKVFNEGTEDMTTPISFTIVEDDLIMPKYAGEIQLLAGQGDNIEIPSEGKTLRIEIPQISNHPFPGILSSFIEKCGEDQSGGFSTGFATMLPTDHPSPNEVVVCEEIIGSFDPNDKAASPKGFKDPHWLKANTDVDYKVRFQNTGTDTAFTVVIRDTLSENLMVDKINVGASSHDYDYYMLDENILVFTFSNILLPDSTTNEPESHGYINFTVSQLPDLEDGTMLFNKAGIFFDFNEAVVTNQVFHTIGEEFIMVGIESLDPNNFYNVKINPNPFRTETFFSFKNESYEDAHLEILDINGKKCFEASTTTNKFKVLGSNLKAGIYFYKLSINNQIIDNGKLITQ